jgi:hypothetical protein
VSRAPKTFHPTSATPSSGFSRIHFALRQIGDEERSGSEVNALKFLVASAYY